MAEEMEAGTAVNDEDMLLVVLKDERTRTGGDFGQTV
jgi:hypothetical protein